MVVGGFLGRGGGVYFPSTRSSGACVRGLDDEYSIETGRRAHDLDKDEVRWKLYLFTATRRPSLTKAREGES